MRPEDSFIEQSVRSLQTMLRVLAEDNKMQPTVVPDGIFGPGTTQAVSTFQRRYGLPITGVANQQTWDRIVLEYESALIRISEAQPIEIIMDPGKVYRYGDSSPNIYLAQSILTQLSKDHPDIEPPGHSGVLDRTTEESLIGFQNLAALPATGELDKITWKHLAHHFTLSAHHEESQTNLQ